MAKANLQSRPVTPFLDDEYVRQHDELSAGQYVMFAVTDTGSGIPPDILERVSFGRSVQEVF